MKALILSLGVFVVFSCKSQTVPLNTLLEDIPQGAYLKDLNNELAPYIGVYRSNFQGNEITLFITKENQKLIPSSLKSFYQDILSIKYVVKNSSGNILQDTQNMNFQPNQIRFSIYSMGTRPSQNIVSLYYGGTNCGIGWGSIYLKKLNSTQISWEYEPNDRVIDSATCPPSVDKTIYLPETKDLIFTKQ
ncbi:hypothetical protein [Chryseobacterium sp. C3]|uniref:hypothetical protein n=1 Tax=Chryseobacterium sp. C3 TaxID=2761532 RepID=UPI0016291004|nr:hypothetical protein [Chryseobacterium sp. C3]